MLNLIFVFAIIISFVFIFILKQNNSVLHYLLLKTGIKAKRTSA